MLSIQNTGRQENFLLIDTVRAVKLSLEVTNVAKHLKFTDIGVSTVAYHLLIYLIGIFTKCDLPMLALCIRYKYFTYVTEVHIY